MSTKPKTTRKRRRHDQPQFVVDEKGNRVQAIIGINTYEQLIEAWETLEDLKAADAAHRAWDRDKKRTIVWESFQDELDVHVDKRRKESA